MSRPIQHCTQDSNLCSLDREYDSASVAPLSSKQPHNHTVLNLGIMPCGEYKKSSMFSKNHIKLSIFRRHTSIYRMDLYFITSKITIKSITFFFNEIIHHKNQCQNIALHSTHNLASLITYCGMCNTTYQTRSEEIR